MKAAFVCTSLHFDARRVTVTVVGGTLRPSWSWLPLTNATRDLKSNGSPRTPATDD
jgi:hypothetical protein